MSADLHVIIFDTQNISPEEIKEYASFEVYEGMPSTEVITRVDRHNELVTEIYGSEDNDFTVAFGEDCWIGQVSWMETLQSAQAKKKHLPAVVQHFEETYVNNGGAMQLTGANIEELLLGFDLPSSSIYEKTALNSKEYDPTVGWLGIAQKEEVAEFLKAHIGKWSFIDSW